MKLLNIKPKRRKASVDCMGCSNLILYYDGFFSCNHPLSLDRKTCPIADTCPCCGKPIGGDES